MADDRKLRKVGKSYVVAVPDWARAHLHVTQGATLYWHKGARGHLLVTVTHTRGAGKPPRDDWRERYERAEQRIKKLEGKLQARPMRVFNEGFSQGFSQAVGGVLLELRSRVTLAQEVLGQLQTQLNAVAGSDLPELADGVQAIRTALEKLTAPVTPSQ